MSELPKRCACGMTYDAAAWAALDLRGEQADDVERLEYRNCVVCGSTLAIVLESFGPEGEPTTLDPEHAPPDVEGPDGVALLEALMKAGVS